MITREERREWGNWRIMIFSRKVISWRLRMEMNRFKVRLSGHCLTHGELQAKEVLWRHLTDSVYSPCCRQCPYCICCIQCPYCWECPFCWECPCCLECPYCWEWPCCRQFPCYRQCPWTIWASRRAPPWCGVTTISPWPDSLPPPPVKTDMKNTN